MVVVDRQEPGLGASYGNAGHLATEQVFPIADLSIIKRLPAMLMDPMGPLRLDWKYLPRALPWFTRLLLNLRPGPYRRSVAGLRALNECSLAAWQRLLRSIDRPDLLRQEGSLLVYERQDSRAAVEGLLAHARSGCAGGSLERGRGGRGGALDEPASARRPVFPATGHFIDPHQVVRDLVVAARASGVRFLKQDIGDGRLSDDGVVLHGSGGGLSARRVLIACGAHSASLTARLTGQRVPLDTERGYHLMLPHEHGRLPFAVTSFERRFIMTPLSGGLRLAGTVEFAGLTRPRRWRARGNCIGSARACSSMTWMPATPRRGWGSGLPCLIRSR